MDIIEQFLNKISYKFEKGYPDMNNEQDILLLENELMKVGINIKESKKPFESLSPKAQEIGKEIMDLLSIPIEQIKSQTSNRIIVLTDENRLKIMTKLVDNGFTRNVNIPGSSQGGVEKNGVEVIIKPLSKQGSQSAGKQNETDFNNIINSHINEYGSPINVLLKSDKKTLLYKNVAKAVDASTKGATDFDKSDTDLIDENGKIIVGISLKKRNAIRWESSKTRPLDGVNVFKSFIEKALQGKFENISLLPLEQKNKYKLYNPIKNKILSKVIIKNTPSDILDKIVFGNTSTETIVVKETFEGGFNDYNFNNGVLTINCYLIYTEIEDIIGTDDEPVFAFSNHIGQAYGIEFRSFSKGLLYSGDETKGSSEEIDFNDLK
jgi:hypothetical protein